MSEARSDFWPPNGHTTPTPWPLVIISNGKTTDEMTKLVMTKGSMGKCYIWSFFMVYPHKKCCVLCLSAKEWSLVVSPSAYQPNLLLSTQLPKILLEISLSALIVTRFQAATAANQCYQIEYF